MKKKGSHTETEKGLRADFPCKHRFNSFDSNPSCSFRRLAWTRSARECAAFRWDGTGDEQDLGSHKKLVGDDSTKAGHLEGR